MAPQQRVVERVGERDVPTVEVGVLADDVTALGRPGRPQRVEQPRAGSTIAEAEAAQAAENDGGGA